MTTVWIKRCAEWIGSEAHKNIGQRIRPDNARIVYESHHIPDVPYASYIAGVNSAVTHFTLPETTTTWASALVLLHRFAARNPTLLTPHTAHRLILTAFLVAMKVVSDQILSNKLVARCGGVTARNLNDMELMFLKDMDYEVFVGRPELVAVQGQPHCVLEDVPQADVSSVPAFDWGFCTAASSVGSSGSSQASVADSTASSASSKDEGSSKGLSTLGSSTRTATTTATTATAESGGARAAGAATAPPAPAPQSRGKLTTSKLLSRRLSKMKAAGAGVASALFRRHHTLVVDIAGGGSSAPPSGARGGVAKAASSGVFARTSQTPTLLSSSTDLIIDGGPRSRSAKTLLVARSAFE